MKRLIAFVAVMFVVGCSDGATPSQRHEWAQDWMKQNHLEGNVTCFNNSETCEVVPSDPRTPFWLICKKHEELKSGGHCNLFMLF